MNISSRALGGGLLSVLVALSAQSQTATLPSWVDSTPQFTWQPKLGGVYWLDSRAVVKEAAPLLTQSPRPVLVDIKSDATGFGYRFDEGSWANNSAIYSYYSWNGTDAGTPASPEDALQIFGASSNAQFIVNIPIPLTLVSTPTSDWGYDGNGYTWQTPQFYAAFVQYLTGTADAPSVWQGLATNLNFFNEPANFNWADLRAARGHVAPYPIVAFIIGEEPYNIEGTPTGALYGPQAEKFRIAIRAAGYTGPLGLHVHDMGYVDDPTTQWFWPMMANVTASDFSYLDLEHYYQFSTVQEDYKRSYPVSVNPDAAYWMPESTWKSDYTKFLWIVQDTRNAIRDDSTVTGLGNSNRWNLGWTEHGIQVASEFEYDDMFSAMHWAGWLAESMRQNIAFDSGWTLLAEGFSTAQIQVVNGHVTRTPMFFAYQMAQQFYGYNYLSNAYVSPMGETTDNIGDAVQYPWTSLRVFSDPATGNLHLFVVNQSTNSSATITGFDNWNVIGWNQLSAPSYASSNTLGVPGPEAIQTQSVALPGSSSSLVIPPISVNHIILSASGAPPVTTNPPTPTVTMASPASGSTVNGTISVTASAANAASVQLQLDGASLGSPLTTSPYTQSLDTTAFANGTYTVSAIATGSSGTQAAATPVTITVSNAAPVTGTPPVSDSLQPTVTIAATVPSAVIGSSTYGEVTFNLTASSSQALNVNFSLGGTAVKWIDYRRPVTGDMPVTITIPAGATSYTMDIEGVTNSTGADPETAIFTLAAGTNYIVGTQDSATITIAPAGTTVPITVATNPPTTTNTNTNTNTNTGTTGTTGTTGASGTSGTTGTTTTNTSGSTAGSSTNTSGGTVTSGNGSGASTNSSTETATSTTVTTNAGLTLVVSGSGSIQHENWKGNLSIGKQYTVTAVAAPGSILSNWAGGTAQPYNDVGARVKYTFTMESNLSLQANFVTNPFMAAAGTYNGLFFENSNAFVAQTAGMIRGLSVKDNGAYTGTLLIDGASHPITGTFNLQGQAANTLARSASEGGALSLAMTLNWSNSPPQITGSVSGALGGTDWTATNLLVDLAETNAAAAAYTVLLAPDTNNAPPEMSPGGSGYASVKTGGSKVTIAGTLADGTAFSQATSLSEDGSVPIYASLYAGKGLLLGWINLGGNGTNAAPTVGLAWVHPKRASGLYAAGFTNVLNSPQISISPWTNQPEGVDQLTQLSLLTTVNASGATVEVPVEIHNNTISGQSVSGSINPKTGAFKVTVGEGATRTTGYGAILFNRMTGAGFYLTKTNAQAVQINP